MKKRTIGALAGAVFLGTCALNGGLKDVFAPVSKPLTTPEVDVTPLPKAINTDSVMRCLEAGIDGTHKAHFNYFDWLYTSRDVKTRDSDYSLESIYVGGHYPPNVTDDHNYPHLPDFMNGQGPTDHWHHRFHTIVEMHFDQDGASEPTIETRVGVLLRDFNQGVRSMTGTVELYRTGDSGWETIDGGWKFDGISAEITQAGQEYLSQRVFAAERDLNTRAKACLTLQRR